MVDDVLQQAPCRSCVVQRAARGRHLRAQLVVERLQLVRHGIEGLGQPAHLVIRGDGCFGGEVPARHALRRGGDREDRTGRAPRDRDHTERKQERREAADEEGQPEQPSRGGERHGLWRLHEECELVLRDPAPDADHRSSLIIPIERRASGASDGAVDPEAVHALPEIRAPETIDRHELAELIDDVGVDRNAAHRLEQHGFHPLQIEVRGEDGR